MRRASPIPARREGNLPNETVRVPAQRATLGITSTGRERRLLHQTARGMAKRRRSHTGSASVHPPGNKADFISLSLSFDDEKK
jgi:hypothetical protein